MREIEIRAWLKNKKKMVKVKAIDFIEEEIRAGGNWYSFEDVELILYTGLKDKNGVKIFEGDIVKSLGYPAIEVIYDKESCSFKMKVRYKEWEDLLILSSNKTPHLEVIGNIYKNKELLEGEEK